MNLLALVLIFAGVLAEIGFAMWLGHYITKTNLAVRGTAPVMPAGDNTPTVKLPRVTAYNPGAATVPGPMRNANRVINAHRRHAVDATRQMSAIDARGPRG